MHVERLQRLDALLIGLPLIPEQQRARKFHLGRWLCDTTACAVGQASLDPWFQAEGLGMEIGRGDTSATPVFGELTGLSAVVAFFEISAEEVFHVFVKDSYAHRDWINPLAVSQRIRSLLAGTLSSLIAFLSEAERFPDDDGVGALLADLHDQEYAPTANQRTADEH